MKKTTFMILFVLSISLHAQNYNFTNLTGTYADLTGTTSINNGEIWDDQEYDITLPFSFAVNGISSNSFSVASNGVIFLYTNPVGLQGVAALNADLEDRGSNGDTSLSPISFKTDGTAGSRIVKIEFKNCGAYSDDAKTMFVNVQIWLYEGSNIIEYRYGSSSITNSGVFYDDETGPLVGVASEDNNFELANTHFLIGSANSPTLSTVNEFINLTGTPSANRIFRFTPTSLNNTNFSANTVSLYPNPFRNSIAVQGVDQTFEYAIYDLQGKIIQSSKNHSSSNPILTEEIASGVYFLKISSNDAIVTKKMIKI